MICLPSFVVDEFKKAISNGSITPDKLDKMSSEERRDFLGSIVGENNAKQVNALFEEKLLLKDQERGMVTWAKQVANLKPEVQKDLISKIQKLDRVLNPEEQKDFLADYAAKRLGTEVSMEEATKISKLAKQALDAKDKNAKLSGVSDEYLSKKNELSQYVESLKPVNVAKDMAKNLAVIARNNLLLNPSTPVKTTIGQVVNSVMDAATRRIGALSLKGSNPDLVKQANSEAWETFRKTGANTASMESLDDTHVLGKGENFKPSTGETTAGKVLNVTDQIIRKTAQISNKVAIDWEHNVPFTKFYQKTFFDMVNLASDKIAQAEKLEGPKAKARSAEVFKDATRIKPETREGAMVRLQAQKQAARITNTNETFLARLTLGTKRAMNDAIPGLGDFIMPIAKIPADIIANGLDNAGVGIPKAVIDIWKGHEKIQSSDLTTRYEGMAQFSNGIQHLGRIVGVMGVGALIASRFNKDNFRQDNYGNSFVKIGNIWINMEYLNAVSPALSGFMSAKMNGNGIGSKIGQYAAGIVRPVTSLPFNEVGTLVNSITNTDLVAGVQKYAKDFFTSRGVPSFIKNLFGPNRFQHLFFGSSGVQSDAQYQAGVTQKKQAASAKAKATRAKNK